ncbi:FAD:protein FMN transferase [Simiduia agarivorans]|uniref:FAD:protein FMN transferase n=1 Tax=Simiduia agarivorans (strain DSM 21679 / JCM 13881 / BCRC 17597 / SA1) TaxID=1117647 RepID=K4KMY7_SIMAS|nr:membrane protein [Simiduia agarivorans SA1 = DSM 21679]
MNVCLRLCAALLLVGAAAVRADWHYQTGQAMGTEIIVQLWHEDPAQAELAALEVLAEMRRIDQWLSPWIDTSELYKVNQTAAQAPVPISAPLFKILDKAAYMSRLSEGAFDITFASVGYRYDYRQGKAPTDAEREALLPAIDYRLVVLDKTARTVQFIHPNVRIDLGGIAKGYAVDSAIALLAAKGIAHASVSAGGDSRILGDKRGRPWMVGIKNPRDEQQLALRLPLTDTAMSTSGDYERFFFDPVTGEREHHIINPRTGKASQGVMSATVLGPSGFDTDPLSTTVFILGAERGLALIDRLPGFDAIVIDATGQVHYSRGLAAPE